MSELTADPTTTTPRPGARIHPRFIELGSLLLIAPLCVVGAIIGVQLIVTLGITANTSLIGALAGMALARIPLTAIHRAIVRSTCRTWRRARSLPRPSVPAMR